MITELIIEFMKNDVRALTKDELMVRHVVLIVFLAVDLWLLVLLLRRLKQKRISKLTALILSVVLVFEAAHVFPFLKSEEQIPLEYVCSVQKIHDRDYFPLNRLWYTDCSVDGPEPVEKELLEHELGCDLSDIEFDADYAYLFVLYYKDVNLFYSNWDETIAATGNPKPKYVYPIWLGRLETTGEATENTIYIYRFPRKAIVPDDAQWL